uniref:Uncharacterized protein n=1 Tax=Arundo donax TaxID=35708 RepID=A0A0A8Y9H4_ARUDO
MDLHPKSSKVVLKSKYQTKKDHKIKAKLVPCCNLGTCSTPFPGSYRCCKWLQLAPNGSVCTRLEEGVRQTRREMKPSTSLPWLVVD